MAAIEMPDTDIDDKSQRQADEDAQALRDYTEPLPLTPRPALPIGFAMPPDAAPSAVSRAAAPTSPILKAAANNAPAPAPAMPMASAGPSKTPQPPMPLKPASVTLFDKARNVQNPFARILAETGATILRGADVAGGALFPSIAIGVPGSTANTGIRNAAKLANWEKEQRIGIERQRAGTEADRLTMDKAGEFHAVPGTTTEVNTRSGESRPIPGVEPIERGKWDLERDQQGNILGARDPAGNVHSLNDPALPQSIRDIADSAKARRSTNPFEAYAYGTPEEKKAAQDFIALEKKLGRENDKPSEVAERYALYKRDPEAYRAMFGDRGEAQDATKSARDAAQASRMLSYFDKRRKEIQNDFTLDDAEQQRQLAEIDALEKPYRDATKAGGGTPLNTATRGGGPQRKYQAGDTVSYRGKPMRVKSVRPDGKLELEAPRANR